MSRRSTTAVSDKLNSAGEVAQAGVASVADTAQQVAKVTADALSGGADSAGAAIGAGIDALSDRRREARKRAKAEADRSRKAARRQADRSRKQARALTKRAKKLNKKAYRTAERQRRVLAEAAAGLLDQAPQSLGGMGTAKRKGKRGRKVLLVVVLVAGGTAAAAANSKRTAGRPQTQPWRPQAPAAEQRP